MLFWELLLYKSALNAKCRKYFFRTTEKLKCNSTFVPPGVIVYVGFSEEETYSIPCAKVSSDTLSTIKRRLLTITVNYLSCLFTIKLFTQKI